MTKHLRLAGVIVCGCLMWPANAGADPVADWNLIASQAAIAANRPGPSAFLDLAEVHVAVYDAVQALDRRFRPYHVHIPGASGSPAAATAKAAHDVLVALYPAQAPGPTGLDAAYHTYLANNSLAEDDPGVFVGQQAAAGILALRANDGSFPAVFPPFLGGTAPGEWRPTESFLPGPPPSFAPMAAPWLADVEPYALRFPSQFRPGPQPQLSSRQYTRAYNEVKALGERVSATRTPEQTDLANFFNDSFLALWQRTLRSIAAARVTRIGDSARLFALATIATADAIITAWDSKRHFAFWRPLTAIQQGDADGNPRTVGQANWQPFINTPPYPDYTSGANNVSAAMARILARYFRSDKMTFTVSSGNALAIVNPRTYHRFSEVEDDVVDVRIYQGIHFRFADVVGRRQGEAVADFVFKHFLRPIHGRDDDDDDDDDGPDGRHR
jgi:hypothetical protein